MRVLAAVAVLAFGVHASDIDPVAVPAVLDLLNKTDPVTKKKVAKGRMLDWHGIRVHFAGEKSAVEFKKTPKKYLALLKLRLVEVKPGTTVVSLENATCPVTGGKVDRKALVDRAGIRVYLSSAGAVKKFTAAPEKHLAKLGYRQVPRVIDLRNITCPVTGDTCYIEAGIWGEQDGIRVHFCCDDCIKEFKQNPKRVFQVLMVDPKKLKTTVR